MVIFADERKKGGTKVIILLLPFIVLGGRGGMSGALRRAAALLLCALTLVTGAATARPLKLPRSWFYLGTFPVSKNELDGDPVQLAPGGIEAQFDVLLGKRKSKDAQRRREWAKPEPGLFSEIVDDGGEVTWHKLPVVNGHTLSVQPPNVNFNKLVQTLVSMEAQEVQGWACLEFAVKRGGR